MSERDHAMSERDHAPGGDEVDRLRAGFAARPAVAPAGHACPDPGQIWDAACGLGAADERRAVVEAVAACGACAEAWRLAVEVARDVTPAEAVARDVTRVEVAARDAKPSAAVDAAGPGPSTPSEGRSPESRGFEDRGPSTRHEDVARSGQAGAGQAVDGARASTSTSTGTSTGTRTRTSTGTRRRRWYAPAFAATAAALVLFVVWRGGDKREGGELRGGEAGAVKALVADGATLPRDAFELRWSAAPEGRYVLSVFTAELGQVHVSPELADTRYQVPEAAFAGVADGVALFWRVDVVTQDRRVPSATYRVIVR